MNTYTSVTGKTLEVIPTGKSFKSIINYPATKHSAAETVVKRHRCYSAVEKLIARGGFTEA